MGKKNAELQKYKKIQTEIEFSLSSARGQTAEQNEKLSRSHERCLELEGRLREKEEAMKEISEEKERIRREAEKLIEDCKGQQVVPETMVDPVHRD